MNGVQGLKRPRFWEENCENSFDAGQVFVWEPALKRREEDSQVSDFFLPGPARAKRPLEDMFVDDNGWKRCRPTYWADEAGGKRKFQTLADGQDIPWLEDLAVKRQAIVLHPAPPRAQRLRCVGDGERLDDLWFGRAQLSRIPPVMFEVPRPESRIMLWHDQEQLVRDAITPRVEILDDDYEEAAPAPAAAQEEENLDVMPMDLSD